VAYLLKLWSQRNGRCQPTALKRHLFLGNGSETDNGTTSVARQQILNKQEETAAAREWLGKDIPAEKVRIRE
jgi:hypothetical protein